LYCFVLLKKKNNSVLHVLLLLYCLRSVSWRCCGDCIKGVLSLHLPLSLRPRLCVCVCGWCFVTCTVFVYHKKMVSSLYGKRVYIRVNLSTCTELLHFLSDVLFEVFHDLDCCA
jgi:hypothetical protein